MVWNHFNLEERNIAYVSATRAKQELYVCMNEKFYMIKKKWFLLRKDNGNMEKVFIMPEFRDSMKIFSLKKYGIVKIPESELGEYTSFISEHLTNLVFRE